MEFGNRLIKIGVKIKCVRHSQGLTQIKLSEMAGVDYNTLAKV
jgi:transcriptional regulator with XRE-family HTH domain